MKPSEPGSKGEELRAAPAFWALSKEESKFRGQHRVVFVGMSACADSTGSLRVICRRKSDFRSSSTDLRSFNDDSWAISTDFRSYNAEFPGFLADFVSFSTDLRFPTLISGLSVLTSDLSELNSGPSVLLSGLSAPISGLSMLISAPPAPISDLSVLHELRLSV